MNKNKYLYINGLRRRLLMAGAAWPALAWAGEGWAQTPGKVWRVAFLSPGSTASHGLFFDAFRHSMRELGYVEGKNLGIETRWAEGKQEQLAKLAAELVQLKPDVMVSGASAGHFAAKNATSTIPIVMASGSDPVASGLIASLARPGGNLTGVTHYVGDIHPKLLELLHTVVPKAGRIAILTNARAPLQAVRRSEIEAAAKRTGIRIEHFAISSGNDIDAVFNAMRQSRVTALLVTSDSMLLALREPLVRLASSNRVTAIYPFSEFAEAGGFMSYSASLKETYRRAAYYVDRILRARNRVTCPWSSRRSLN